MPPRSRLPCHPPSWLGPASHMFPLRGRPHRPISRTWPHHWLVIHARTMLLCQAKFFCGRSFIVIGPLYSSLSELSELYRRSRKFNSTRLRNSTAPGPRQHTTVLQYNYTHALTQSRIRRKLLVQKLFSARRIFCGGATRLRLAAAAEFGG
jgi:hypothetical protein